MSIGQWVRRPAGTPPFPDSGGFPETEPTKWHFVESVVDGAAITRCGRRMEPVSRGRSLETSDVMPLARLIGQPQLCKAGCDR